jgi:hypothetical protein
MGYTPRTIQQIVNQITASKNADSNLNGLTSTSQVAYWKLWIYIQAVATNLLEQIMSIFLDEIQTIESQSHAGTIGWVQNEVLKFQYPDVVQINPDFTFQYATINPSLQIITNCAVTVGNTGALTVKVTTGVPAGAISSDEQIALTSYLDAILSPNQFYTIVSQDGDALYITGTVFYNGQYQAAIQTNVEAALTAYINKFATSSASGGGFNGVVKLSDIENVILSVAGVVDWQPSMVAVTPFGGSMVYLMKVSTIISRNFQTVAGYVKEAGPFSSTISYQIAAN